MLDVSRIRLRRERRFPEDRPTVALAAVAHALAQPLFYMSEDSGFAIRAVSPALRAAGIEDGKAMKHIG